MQHVEAEWSEDHMELEVDGPTTLHITLPGETRAVLSLPGVDGELFLRTHEGWHTAATVTVQDDRAIIETSEGTLELPRDSHWDRSSANVIETLILVPEEQARHEISGRRYCIHGDRPPCKKCKTG